MSKPIRIDANIIQRYNINTNSLEREDFVPGATGAGWKLWTENDTTTLEVDNIFVRDTLRASIFQKEIIKATNGQLYVSDSGIVDSVNTGTSTIYFKDSNSATFADGDLLKVRDLSQDGSLIAVVEFGVGNPGTSVNGITPYNYTVISGDMSTIESGMTAVRVSGANILIDASSANAPYLKLNDGTSDKVVIGNLDAAPAGTGYGLYGENVYLTGNITATDGSIGGWSINGETLVSGGVLIDAANEAISIQSGTRGYTFPGIYMEYNSGSPRFSLVNSTDTEYLFWDGSKLTIEAANFSLNSSGNIAATGGSIGGWTIDETTLSGGGITLNSGATGTQNAISSTNFNVTAEGNLSATGADITGQLNLTTAIVYPETSYTTYIGAGSIVRSLSNIAIAEIAMAPTSAGETIEVRFSLVSDVIYGNIHINGGASVSTLTFSTLKSGLSFPYYYMIASSESYEGNGWNIIVSPGSATSVGTWIPGDEVSGSIITVDTVASTDVNAILAFLLSGETPSSTSSVDDFVTDASYNNGTITLNRNVREDITIDISDLLDTNNYLTGLSFNTGDGVLTATRSGLSNLTVDLDGRYEPIHSHPYLPLAGGTLTGDITFAQANPEILFVPSGTNDAAGIRFNYTNNDGVFEFWTSDDYNEPFVWRAYDVGLDGTVTYEEWMRLQSKILYVDNNVVYHAGNFISGVDYQPAGTYDNYASWSFAVDGVNKDEITSGDVLDFVSGTLVTISRSDEDKVKFDVAVDWSDLGGTQPAPIAHDHIIGNITGLQDELDAKANLSGADFSGSIQLDAISQSSSSSSNSIIFEHYAVLGLSTKSLYVNSAGELLFNGTEVASVSDIPTVNNTGITLNAGTGLTGGGVFNLNQSSPETITFSIDSSVVTTTTINNYSLNPKFGTTIGFGNDTAVLYFNDGNSETRTDYWTSKDGFEVRGDSNSMDNVVLKSGNLQINSNVHIGNKVSAKEHIVQDSSGIDNVTMRYDSTSKSLKFVFA